MIISFRCLPGLKEKVDALIAEGLYPDFSSFCITAIENQLLLEEATGADEIGLNSKKSLKRRLSPKESPKKMPASGVSGTTANMDVVKSSAASLGDEHLTSTENRKLEVDNDLPIPLDLRLDRLNGEPPFPLPSMLADFFQVGQIIPVNRWLFGQYNRLLPAKVSIRALAIISLEGKDSLGLATVAPRIAEIASIMSNYLQFLDKRFANHRDDALATAFPVGGAEGQKGRVRYQNHFVGHTVKGEQGGMLVGMKLAVVQVHKNKPHIFPTIAGWEFARLRNPILDTPANQNPHRLSEEEIAFLLKHIKENVPVELFAYRVILSLISKGDNTPELVNQNLAEYITPERNPENEQDFMATQRNGAIGRMIDVGLVGRERQGTRVIYYLTPEGKKFLDGISAISTTKK
jgi:hypothetical protein